MRIPAPPLSLDSQSAGLLLAAKLTYFCCEPFAPEELLAPLDPDVLELLDPGAPTALLDELVVVLLVPMPLVLRPAL